MGSNVWLKSDVQKGIIVYIFDPYFINTGRDCGLLPKKESKPLALFKNKLQNCLTGEPNKYHDLFILGYRDGMGMTAPRIEEILEVLRMSMPTCYPFKRNAKAQIAGFMMARKDKFGF